MPFEKKSRDHLAKQEIMQECITDALRKQEGGNCSRSFQSIAKVMIETCFNVTMPLALTLANFIRQLVTGATRTPLCSG
jgi:hypothetical protein